MKLPEIPGRIMVQTAMAPQMNMNQRSSGVVVGDRVQMTTPRAMPTAKNIKSSTFHPLIS